MIIVFGKLYLHGRAHGVEEVNNDEGEDGEPLLPRETAHGYVLSPDGLKEAISRFFPAGNCIFVLTLQLV